MEASDAVTPKPQPPAARGDASAEPGWPGAGHPLYGHCAKRQSIIAAAEDAFARDGLAAASIDAIALGAGVARQTIYNHYRDKETLFAAVVTAMAERANAGLLRTIASFPDRPDNLAAALAAFGERLIRTCLCDRDCAALRRLVEREGARHPALFAGWRADGPDRLAALIGARLSALAHHGLLVIDDPEQAARQLIALVHADIQIPALLGGDLDDTAIAASSAAGIGAFLRAYGARTG